MKEHGDVSRHLRQKDILDRAERKHIQDMQRVILRPRWRELTGDTPTLAPADIEGAKNFLRKILDAISRGGWTIDERNRLKALKRRWVKKASGNDAWFNANGNPVTHTGGGQNKDARQAWEDQQWEWKRVRKPPQGWYE